MKDNTRIAPPNSVVLVMDRSVGNAPRTMGKEAIAATPTCIAVGTLSAADGETLISLSDEDCPAGQASFDAVLDTPARKVAVCSVHNKTILECDVASPKSRVRVWVNHPIEPSIVQIVVEPLTH